MPWSSLDPEWDHDHCEFCSRKFASTEIPDATQEGYGTLDFYYWVCAECFDDFREEFGWTVITDGFSPPRH